MSGTSSARPDDLDAWTRASRAADEVLALRRAALARLADTFSATSTWGGFDASSLLGALGAWLEWNERDADWVARIAAAFRAAGAEGGMATLPDAALDATLAAAGLGGERTSVSFDDPVAWSVDVRLL